ncbi:MAG: ribonuclease HI [Clostridia bacterium]|nr:ribonuclease HI [Clostridia bacterium]
MKHVDLYTDGACSGNPGPGGYGAILIFKGIEKELSGGFPETTNNRMEIYAVIVGLEQLKEPCEVTVYSDSAYTVNAFLQGWLAGWKRNGWKKGDGKAVANVDLWQRLLALTEKHDVSFVKVKGHADNAYNNRCDLLATTAIKRLSSSEGT